MLLRWDNAGRLRGRGACLMGSLLTRRACVYMGGVRVCGVRSLL